MQHSAQVPRARFKEGTLVSCCVDKCVRVWNFEGWLPPPGQHASSPPVVLEIADGAAGGVGR